MTGSVYKRCGCRGEDGKQLGKRCPKLRRSDGTWNPRHGSWAFVVDGPRGVGGRRRQIPKGGFRSEDEARREMNGLLDRLRRGGSAREVVGREYFPGWLAGKVDVKPSTLRGYRLHVQRYVIPHLGHLRLSELRTEHVRGMLAEVGGGDANRQRVRATLRAALADAQREGLIVTNPAALVKLPSGARPKALVWTQDREQRWRDAGAVPSPVMVWRADHLARFLAVTRTAEVRLHALFHVAGLVGLRRGELCALCWSDLDLDEGTLTVRRSRVQVGWAVVEGEPKSVSSARTVALEPGTVSVLREHRKRQAAERLAWGAGYRDHDLLFARENGAPLHPASVTRRFGQLVGEADLPPIGLHGLRHGAASLMLAAGVPMKVVQETLGHSMMSVTSDTYSSVFPSVAADAAAATAALVSAATGTAGTDVVTGLSRGGSARATKRDNRRSGVGRAGFEPATRRIMSPLL